MTNPIAHVLSPYSGLKMVVVEAGTVVKDERSGEEMTVDDGSAVTKGSVIYCTQKTFDLVKDRFADALG